MRALSKAVVLWVAAWIESCGSVQAAVAQTNPTPQPADGAKAGRVGGSERGEKEQGSGYLRIRRDLDGMPVALETVTVRLTPASGEGDLVVDLVAAVHMADREYYRQLNRQFEKYDVVLYELVAPRGTRVTSGGRSRDNPLAMIQQVASVALDLDSQIDQVDYTRANFVHADLSPEEMAEAMRRRGDDGLTLFLSIMADLLRQQNLQQMRQDTERRETERGRGSARRQRGDAQPEPDLAALLLDPEGAAKLKRTLAQQFAQATGPGGGLGSTLQRILVADRNEAALRVFQTELAKGKKRIAIFYGAAHMEDFEKRLSSEFGLKRQQEQWLTAWDLRGGKSGLERMLRLLEPLSH
jgi:hypothetical protein